MVTDRTPDYNKYAKVYDKTEATETEARTLKNRTIEGILKRYGTRTVLDLTCGTGDQVFWLAERGYGVVGSDISPAMLSVARRRAMLRKMRIKFLQGDMRNVEAGTFDAAITIFNAVGHLSKQGFERAMRNIRDNLKDGGIYVFDILNASMSKPLEEGLLVNTVTEAGAVAVHKLQVCRINRRSGILTMDEVFCTWRKNGRIKIGKPVRWTMQIYGAKELRDMLARNGFKVLGQYSWPDGGRFLGKNSSAILTVARKVRSNG